MRKLKTFFPYSCQTIDNDDIKEVVKTLKSNFITQGQKFQNLRKTLQVM